jgi:gliding motility-associated-like protein
MYFILRISVVLFFLHWTQYLHSQSIIREYVGDNIANSAINHLHKFSNGDLLKTGRVFPDSHFELSRINADLSSVIWTKIYKFNNLICEFELPPGENKDTYIAPTAVFVDDEDHIWLGLHSYFNQPLTSIINYVLLDPNGDLIWQRGSDFNNRHYNNYEYTGNFVNSADGVDIYFSNNPNNSVHDSLNVVSFDRDGNSKLKTIFSHQNLDNYHYDFNHNFEFSPDSNIILLSNNVTHGPSRTIFGLHFLDQKIHTSFLLEGEKFGILLSAGASVEWLNDEEFIFYSIIADTIKPEFGFNTAVLISRVNINGDILWSKVTDLSKAFFSFNHWWDYGQQPILIEDAKLVVPINGFNGIGSGFITLDIETGEVLSSNFWYKNDMNPINTSHLFSGRNIYLSNHYYLSGSYIFDKYAPFILIDNIDNPSSCIKIPGCNFELYDFPLEFELLETPLIITYKDSVLESNCSLRIEIIPVVQQWREICPEVVQQPDAFFTLRSDTICQKELVPVVVQHNHQYFEYTWTLNGQIVEPVNASNDTFYFNFDLEGEAELFLTSSRLGCKSEYSVSFYLLSGAQIEAAVDTIICKGKSIYLPLKESDGYIIEWENGTNLLQIDTAGIYTYTSINIATGCTFKKSIEVKEQNPPQVNIDSFYSFCADDIGRSILPKAIGLDTKMQWIYPDQPGNFILFPVKSDTYLLKVEKQGCVDTIKVEVEILPCTETFNVFIPEAFSPNDDGINDYFELFMGCQKGILTFKMEIFDRWGNMVFQSDEPQSQWDGNFEGKIAPAGGYTYKLKMTLELENEFEEVFREGFIGLIR